MSAMGSISRLDPPDCFVTYGQWIFDIHVRFNTCRPLGRQHGNQVILIHLLAHIQAVEGLESKNFNRRATK